MFLSSRFTCTYLAQTGKSYLTVNSTPRALTISTPEGLIDSIHLYSQTKSITVADIT